MARLTFGSSYAGLSVNQDGQVVVYKTGPVPTKLPDELSRVAVKSVRYSLDELQAYKNKLDLNADKVINGGASLSVWGIDPAANAVAVTVTGDEGRARSVITNLLGPMPLVVTVDAPVQT